MRMTSISSFRQSSPLALLTAAALSCWLGTTRAVAQSAEPMGHVDEVIFPVREPKGPHWYENFGYYAQDENKKVYGAGGRLCRLDIASGELTVLLDDPTGAIRDPQVHYDAAKILFSYRPGDTDHFHLYEINVDGSDLKQLTDGPYDDLEPSYLPDNDIVFCSSRCNRWMNC